MESYLEYPIRCKTCNGQIACFSYEYNELLNAKYTIQQALDQLGLMNFCCRISMKDPVVVTFNMENREVIEGIKKIDTADDFGVSATGSANTTFGACTVSEVVQPVVKEIKQKIKGVQPIAPVNLTNAVAIGDGIDIDVVEMFEEFVTPTVVGISTINRFNLSKPEIRSVGSGKESRVLNGRTYLAR